MRFLVAIVVLLMSAPAWAQSEADKSTARDLFFSARDALEAEDYASAANLFERSNQLYPAPTAALGWARALVKLGELVRAHEVYATITSVEPADDASAPFRRAHQEAVAEQAKVAPRLAAVVLQIAGPKEPVVTIDGEPVPIAALGAKRFVNPGKHTVRAAANGFIAREQTVALAEGATVAVRLELVVVPAVAEPKPATRKVTAPLPSPATMSGLEIAGVLVGTLGAVSLVASAVTGGFYLTKRKQVEDECVETSPSQFACATSAGVDAAASGRTLAIANVVTLVGGLAALGTGIALYSVGASSGDEIAVGVGPTSLWFRGSF